jgi:hypothetical protein
MGPILAATSATAQVSSPSLLVPTSATATVAAATSAAPAADTAPAADATVSTPEPSASSKQQRGPVVSVFENYNFEAYIGYTFVRFYQIPNHTQSRNGFDGGLVYYFTPGGRLALDGTLMGTFGGEYGDSSRLVFGGGGARYRWSGPRGVEIWGHGILGESHYTPQTAWGPQGSFGYELGGGVDFTAPRRRLAYRAEVDMLGTRFFGTEQYSPKVSVGIVWKFK